MQADQLWAASQGVGPEASPILLFYALAQASRSLCVAGLGGDAWKAPDGHGVTCDVTSPAADASLKLTQVTVKPTGDSLLRRTSTVLASPVLTGKTDLGSLIASLEADFGFEEEALGAHRPLAVTLDRSWAAVWIDGNTLPLDVGPIPKAWAERREFRAIPPGTPAQEHVVQPSDEEVQAWLRDYPKLATLGVPTSLEIVRDLSKWPDPTDVYFARMRWLAREATSVDDLWERDAAVFDVLTSSGRGRPLEGHVYPTVGGNTESMHPLVTWWLILFSLSMLARYYPRIWSRAIDLDSSTIAAPLRRLLGHAAYASQELLALEVSARL